MISWQWLVIQAIMMSIQALSWQLPLRMYLHKLRVTKLSSLSAKGYLIQTDEKLDNALIIWHLRTSNRFKSILNTVTNIQLILLRCLFISLGISFIYSLLISQEICVAGTSISSRVHRIFTITLQRLLGVGGLKGQRNSSTVSFI